MYCVFAECRVFVSVCSPGSSVGNFGRKGSCARPSRPNDGQGMMLSDLWWHMKGML